jgi:AdoMet-dependent rRNA methyltransferase SPB1
LNAEAAARAKRERRKANEKRTKTIQRMQLQMTAPVEIGVELQDHALSMGQDDILDIDAVGTVMDVFDASDDDADTAPVRARRRLREINEDANDRNDDLEQELDGMYDAYREQLAERDAKFRAKQARKQSKDREETWGGISSKQRDSDEDSDAGGSSESEESEAGGWDVMQRRKRHLGESSDSDSDSGSDSDSDTKPPAKKRKTVVSNSSQVKGKAKSIAPMPSTSRRAQLWFSNDAFASVNDELAALEDEEDVQMQDDVVDEDESSTAWQSDVSIAFAAGELDIDETLLSGFRRRV